MHPVRTVVGIIVFGLFLILFPSLTLAQQTPAQQTPPQQTDLNDSQLRSFAKVYVQVEKILKTYEPQLKQAKTPEEGKQIQKEAMSKVDQAISQEGMDAQSYHRTIEIANADDELRKKLLGFINEERQKS